jgi:nucleotide-binding universal stress UspA family protein
MVVGFDFSPLADLALREAAALVGMTAESELHLVWAVDRYRDWTPPEGELADLDAQIEQMRATAEQALKAQHDRIQVEVFHHVVDAAPATAICEVAEEVGADLILVGTHGRTGVRRALLGSVAEKVVREAACPVLVMRPRRAPQAALQPEPPCPACTAARERSAGAEPWCEVHAGPWRPPHRYTYRGGALEPFRADRAP